MYLEAVCPLGGGSAFQRGICLPPPRQTSQADPPPRQTPPPPHQGRPPPSACWDRSHGQTPRVGQTNACENITFARFATWAVITTQWESKTTTVNFTSI